MADNHLPTKPESLYAPSYVDEKERLLTYRDWPIGLTTTPHILCKAGFYYIGLGDLTRCFDCGIGIKHWIDNDDPWLAHALSSPKCNYVLTVKGNDFVKSVQASNSSATVVNVLTNVSDLKIDELQIDETNTESEKTLCKVCYKEEVTIVFLPCRHFVSCITCTFKLSNCPVCRHIIYATLKAKLC